VAADQLLGLDAVTLTVAAVGGDDPVVGVDDDEWIRQDIDDLVARGLAPGEGLRVQLPSSATVLMT